MDLKGKVAVVTGGNGGLGQRICHALAAEGCHIAVVYAQSRDQATAVAHELEKHQVGAEPFDRLQRVVHRSVAERHQGDDRGRADDDSEDRKERPQLVQPQPANCQDEAAPGLIPVKKDRHRKHAARHRDTDDVPRPKGGPHGQEPRPIRHKTPHVVR